MPSVERRDTRSLSEFLLARIAEDEQAASRYRGSLWSFLHGEHATGDLHSDGNLVVRWPKAPIDQNGPLAHIARWSPARVLAECEAKRQIIASALPDDPQDEWTTPTVFKLLALPYAGHPDYRAEWRLDDAER